MDVVSSNLANMDTTRAKQVDGKWEPYRRKLVTLQPSGESFSSILNSSMNSSGKLGNGVKVTKLLKTKLHSTFNMILQIPMPMKMDMFKHQTLIH